MIEPMGSNIIAIFRLLSPDEIDRYIDAKEVRKVEGTMVAGGEEFTYAEHNGPKPDSPLKKQKKSDSEGQSNQAEIIPIGQLRKEKQQDEQKSDQPKASANLAEKRKSEVKHIKDHHRMPSGKSDLEAVGILSATTLREIEQERLREEMSKRDSTTAFLIKERQKMRDSKKRLIEQHAYKMYQQNAAQELFDSEDLYNEEDELSDGSAKGILINKKQY